MHNFRCFLMNTAGPPTVRAQANEIREQKGISWRCIQYLQLSAFSGHFVPPLRWMSPSPRRINSEPPPLPRINSLETSSRPLIRCGKQISSVSHMVEIQCNPIRQILETAEGSTSPRALDDLVFQRKFHSAWYKWLQQKVHGKNTTLIPNFHNAKKKTWKYRQQSCENHYSVLHSTLKQDKSRIIPREAK